MTTTLPDRHLASASPWADSGARLEAMYPEQPRAYAVSAISEERRRRWWPLRHPERAAKIGAMLARATADLGSDRAGGLQVASDLTHSVIGRVASLVILDGRAWDPHWENLWVHMDIDEGIDRVAVEDRRLRVLPDDPAAGRAGVEVLPCERALLVWVAHRSIVSLTELFGIVGARSGLGQRAMWALVGESILGAATTVPLLTGLSDTVGFRRGQGLLDIFTAAGLPVRSRVAANSLRFESRRPEAPQECPAGVGAAGAEVHPGSHRCDLQVCRVR